MWIEIKKETGIVDVNIILLLLKYRTLSSKILHGSVENVALSSILFVFSITKFLIIVIKEYLQ